MPCAAGRAATIAAISSAVASSLLAPRSPYADLHQRLLERYAPPSVLINHEGDIVYLSEKAGQYLRYVGGEPSHNLIALIVPELRLELRTALFQIAQNGADIETRPVVGRAERAIGGAHPGVERRPLSLLVSE